MYLAVHAKPMYLPPASLMKVPVHMRIAALSALLRNFSTRPEWLARATILYRPLVNTNANSLAHKARLTTVLDSGSDGN